MSYIIKLENFEGPFDLLLQLIEQQHLDITELSLSKVTEDYLDYVQNLDLSLNEMNWFLYVATRLVLSKSQKLLQLHVESENTDIEDLTESLRRYQLLKKLVSKLQAKAEQPLFGRQGSKTTDRAVSVSAADLQSAILLAAQEYNQRAKQISIKSQSSVVRKIRQKFLQEIKQLKTFSLQSTIETAPSRAQAVIYFTTILELLRNQEVQIHGEQLAIVGERA